LRVRRSTHSRRNHRATEAANYLPNTRWTFDPSAIHEIFGAERPALFSPARAKWAPASQIPPVPTQSPRHMRGAPLPSSDRRTMRDSYVPNRSTNSAPNCVAAATVASAKARNEKDCARTRDGLPMNGGSLVRGAPEEPAGVRHRIASRRPPQQAGNPFGRGRDGRRREVAPRSPRCVTALNELRGEDLACAPNCRPPDIVQELSNERNSMAG
jgi:hypothetical protein